MVKWLVLWLAFATVMPARAQVPGFDDATVGRAGSGARGELTLPNGAPPIAGVVVLHGCNGVAPHHRTWAARLAQWGYAALLVDSFGPRGFKEVCNHGRDVPPDARARDAFDAADYLRGRPELRGRRIGLIGFSHGGWGVTRAVVAGIRRPDEPPFAAAVGYYPGCPAPLTALETDTLILIDDADDWSPVARCERWRDQVVRAGHVVDMKIYPGALHGFDTAAPPHDFVGHHIGRDPAAAADAEALTRAFFAARLGP